MNIYILCIYFVIPVRVSLAFHCQVQQSEWATELRSKSSSIQRQMEYKEMGKMQMPKVQSET